MHHALSRSVFLGAACALLGGCASFNPDWSWPGERPPAASVPVAAVVAMPAPSLEDACHAQAWQHRLDILGDERLSYGQAFRRCMGQQAASNAPAAAADRDTPAAVRRPLPARASRN